MAGESEYIYKGHIYMCEYNIGIVRVQSVSECKQVVVL